MWYLKYLEFNEDKEDKLKLFKQVLCELLWISSNFNFEIQFWQQSLIDKMDKT